MAVGRYRQSAVFQPFTFEQMIKPYQMLKEEYDKIEADLNTLQDNAALYKRYVENNPDSPISIQYNNYINDLESEVGSMMSGNRNVGEAKNRLSELRRRYMSDIKPLEQAVANREKWNDYFIKNPDLVGDADINKFIQNPDYTPSSVSRKDLETSIGTIAQRHSQGTPFKNEGYVDPETKSQIVYSQGFSPEELNSTIANVLGAIETGNTEGMTGMSKEIAEQALASGVNKDNVNRLLPSIIQGTGVAGKRYITIANPELDIKLKRAQINSTNALASQRSFGGSGSGSSSRKPAQPDANTFERIKKETEVIDSKTLNISSPFDGKDVTDFEWDIKSDSANRQLWGYRLKGTRDPFTYTRIEYKEPKQYTYSSVVSFSNDGDDISVSTNISIDDNWGQITSWDEIDEDTRDAICKNLGKDNKKFNKTTVAEKERILSEYDIYVDRSSGKPIYKCFKKDTSAARQQQSPVQNEDITQQKQTISIPSGDNEDLVN